MPSYVNKRQTIRRGGNNTKQTKDISFVNRQQKSEAAKGKARCYMRQSVAKNMYEQYHYCLLPCVM